MIFKAVGGVLMLAASVGIGSIIASGAARRIDALEEALALIKYIRRQIEAYLTPIDTILREYRSEKLERCGFAAAMREDGLQSAVCGGYLFLSEEAEAYLKEFADRLGSDYADSELKHCDYYITVLEEVAAGERESLSLNGRLYRFLPPLGVISLIILLL